MDKNNNLQTRTLFLFDVLIALRVLLDDVGNILITIFFPLYLLIKVFNKNKS